MKLIPVSTKSNNFKLRILRELTSSNKVVYRRARKLSGTMHYPLVKLNHIANIVKSILTINDPVYYLGMGTSLGGTHTIMAPHIGIIEADMTTQTPPTFPMMFVIHQGELKMFDIDIEDTEPTTSYFAITRPVNNSQHHHHLVENETAQFWGSILKLQCPRDLFHVYSQETIRRFNASAMSDWTLCLWWLNSAQHYRTAIVKLQYSDVFMNVLTPWPTYSFDDATLQTMHLFNTMLRVIGQYHIEKMYDNDESFLYYFPTYFFGLMFFQSNAVLVELERIKAELVPLVIEYVLRKVGVMMVENYNVATDRPNITMEWQDFHYPKEAEIKWFDRNMFEREVPATATLFKQYLSIVETLWIEEIMRDLFASKHKPTYGATG